MHRGRTAKPMALVTDLTSRRLLAVLAAEQRTGRLPSMVATVTRDGSLVWRGSRGEHTGEPGVSPFDLQYRIGSLTKTMTAVMVMQCRDEGLLSLSDPISAVLPEVDSAVTFRALLAHSSGLVAEPPGDWWERVEGVPFTELAASLPAESALTPGQSYHYSNVGYALLGEAVARLRGMSWWEALLQKVLQPLGMLRTTYDPFFPHAHGYSVAPYSPTLLAEPQNDAKAMAPAGQLWSTVMDLATYADFLITGHPEVLDAASLAEMSTPQSGTHQDGLTSGYGLGLRLLPGGSGVLVGHTGSMPGFLASLFVDRRRRVGAVVMANGTVGLRTDAVAGRLMEVLERCEPWVGEEWTPQPSVPAQVEELLGVWFWGATERTATWDGELLWLSTGRGAGRVDGFRWTGEQFVGVAGYHHGEPLTVVHRDDGSISHLECSTFVLTRRPYDPGAPIPGGPPAEA